MTLTILMSRRARCKRWRGERGRFPSARRDIHRRAQKSHVRDTPRSESSHNTSRTQLDRIWPRWWSHATKFASEQARAFRSGFNAALLSQRARQSTRRGRSARSFRYRGHAEALAEALRGRAGETPSRHGDRQCSRARTRAPYRTGAPRTSSTSRRVSSLWLGATGRAKRPMWSLRKDSQCQR